MSKKARQQEEAIKRKIVDGYRRGVCTWEGNDIPQEKRGSAGKGSRFIFRPNQAYRDNYDRIFGRRTA
jgi:hypothetical protein